MRLGFQHTYATLPGRFYARVDPTPVADPQLVVLNTPLAEDLGLRPDLIEPAAAAVLSGNQLPEDARPLAMAYAGHQFGVFVPQLGDGRAILL
ncbi:MAG TPA: protein adenylyltransferase SelO family protein, partial [Steroidobacteraceae bacterium]|nr:protein adenylyltransferase SelO family protein [Steroidobacteraceae bacterium]